jgi:hypothetical protein
LCDKQDSHRIDVEPTFQYPFWNNVDPSICYISFKIAAILECFKFTTCTLSATIFLRVPTRSAICKGEPVKYAALVRFEVFTAEIYEECHFLGCDTVWLL